MSGDERLATQKNASDMVKFKWGLAGLGAAVFVLAILVFRSNLVSHRDLNSRDPASTVKTNSKHHHGQIDQDDWASRFSVASSNIAYRILPTLVSVHVNRDVSSSEDDELVSYFGQLPIPKSVDTGSGFFIRPDGWIVTNYHVVRQAKTIEVIQADGIRSTAQVKSFDSLSDLAMLKIEATDRPWLAWSPRSAATGELVWVAGSPFGLQGSLSMGIVSAVDRWTLSGSPLRDYLQTDAVVNPGHSGGPIVNANGEVVGVASVILGDEYRGIGFALPSAIAKSVSDQLVDRGAVVRGWIGAQFGQVTQERARKSGRNDLKGAYVERIAAATGSPAPAQKAGLQIGDICTALNDQIIQSQFDLGRGIAMLKPREVASLSIIRNGRTLTIDVVVEEKR